MEQVLYRFTLAAAVLSSLFCAAIFVTTFIEDMHNGSDRTAAGILTVVSPLAILATFYTLRWIIAGRWTAKKERAQHN